MLLGIQAIWKRVASALAVKLDVKQFDQLDEAVNKVEVALCLGFNTWNAEVITSACKQRKIVVNTSRFRQSTRAKHQRRRITIMNETRLAPVMIIHTC